MKYAAKKTAMMLLTMVIVSFLAFLAFQIIPGDAAVNKLGSDATVEAVEALRHEMGLDRPFFVRYGEWVLGALRGDFGASYSYSMSVSQMLAGKLPITALLTALAFLLIVVISIPLGIFTAGHAGGRFDKALTVANQVLMAVPPFFTGVLLTLIFGLTLRWFTPGAFVAPEVSFWRSVGYLMFPAVSIALPRIAMTVKMLKGSILTELERDYVRTSYSRGNSRRTTLYRHVLRNAVPATVTFLAMTVADIVAGSVVIEQVFAIPGLGRLLLSSISGRDYPVVQADSRVLGRAGEPHRRPHQPAAGSPAAPVIRGGERMLLHQKKNHYLRVGLVMTALITLLAVVGAFWTPYEPTAIAGGAKFAAPSLGHLFGTDNFGRDIFSRVMCGVGTTFFIALGTILLGAGVGILIGAFTGYFGGVVDETLMRINDAITAFPSILLALVFIALLGFGKYNVILALGIAFVPSYARVVRGEFARHREMNYVKSARLMGAGHLRIMFVHILPNTRQVILPTLVIGFNNAVLAEASMSYLGIGVKPPDVSLGYMLSESQAYMSAAPWYMLACGLSIVWLILGVSLIGEGLQRKGGV